MSDTTQTLQLPGAELAAIEQDGDTWTLHFSRVELVQEMEGAFEDSLWTQAIDLVIHNAAQEGSVPDCPCVLQGGEFTDNIYTWRNHARLPVKWRGAVGCRLQVEGMASAFSLTGSAMETVALGYPRYIRHIKES